MTAQAAQPARPPRTLSRDARRSQIIDATIQTLATRGFARTTLTEVARTAGLSHGLVLFHFDTKEGLLAETLAYLAEEYRQNWQAALESAGPAPADQLAALIEADFSPPSAPPSASPPGAPSGARRKAARSIRKAAVKKTPPTTPRSRASAPASSPRAAIPAAPSAWPASCASPSKAAGWI